MIHHLQNARQMHKTIATTFWSSLSLLQPLLLPIRLWKNCKNNVARLMTTGRILLQRWCGFNCTHCEKTESIRTTKPLSLSTKIKNQNARPSPPSPTNNARWLSNAKQLPNVVHSKVFVANSTQGLYTHAICAAHTKSDVSHTVSRAKANKDSPGRGRDPT